MPGKKRKTKEEGKKRDNKMKNRRGLSTIVVTLILVVIVLIAVILLWVPIRNLLRQQTQLTQAQSTFFSEEMNILSVYSNSPYINITLKRLGGEIKPGLETTPGNSSGLEADIFSVNDLSGSMADPIPPSGTKLSALQAANINFSQSIFGYSDGNTRIGLVAYSTTALAGSSLDLTKDINALTSKINSWATVQTTCICCGIKNATDKLQLQSSSDKMKAIILMTDGIANVDCNGIDYSQSVPYNKCIAANCPAKISAINNASYAHSTLNNLIIYTVGFGDPTITDPTAKGYVDNATLIAIAQAGGGQYFSASNLDELTGVYQLIAQQIRDRYHSISSFNYLYVKFYNQTGSYQEKVYDMPDVLGSKTYNFNLAGEISGTIIRIEVYPVVVTSSGQEVIGPVLASWQPSF